MESAHLVLIAQALAWPLVAALAIVVLRRPLAKLIASLGRRGVSVGYNGVTIELAAATLERVAPDWIAEGQDLRGLSSDRVLNSHLIAIFHQVQNTRKADYVIVDLRGGKAWLSSRLYIFAKVFGEALGVRAFVFVTVDGHGVSDFVGFAKPGDICRKLAGITPLFEDALITARQRGEARMQADPEVIPPLRHDQIAHTDTATLQQITHDFVHKIRQPHLLPQDDPEKWVFLEAKPNAPARYERAHWLTPQWLGQVLGDALSWESFHDTPGLDDAARKAMVLRRSGDMVARLDSGRRFLELIDRRALLEALAPEAAREIEATQAGVSSGNAPA